jgi:hypothetical protein
MHPVFFHGDDIAMGGLFLVMGIYGFAFLYFTSNRPLSTVMTNKQYRFLFAGLMVVGAGMIAAHFLPD